MRAESIEREVCRELCAYKGEPPCWTLPELSSDAGPECLAPCDDCSAVAALIRHREKSLVAAIERIKSDRDGWMVSRATGNPDTERVYAQRLAEAIREAQNLADWWTTTPGQGAPEPEVAQSRELEDGMTALEYEMWNEPRLPPQPSVWWLVAVCAAGTALWALGWLIWWLVS